MHSSFARLARAAALAVAVSVALAAPAFAQKGPVAVAGAGAYDVNQLNGQVRAAVLEARAAEARANSAATRARSAEAQAHAAARNARNGQSGHRVYQDPNDSDQRHYEGGWSNNTRNGYGVMDFNAGAFIGDRYAGQFSDGSFIGVGVYTWADNANNVNNVGARHEGEFRNDKANGPGVFYYTSGDRYAGDNNEWHSTGYGVLNRHDGSRYEGQWSNDQRHGYGVEWDASGRIVGQGVFTNDELTTNLR